ncbi:hypothetical protein ACSNOK_17070 [Streptomyces sp. URMC 126]|uniref:hypothetical protein n=1 Tax=Streptomyces sp. URMC 126 TaxID=3423401 RepID=UPI003F19B60B
MAVETLRHESLVLQAELLEELMAPSETAVSDAPLPRPECGISLGGVLILSPKQPKEPRRR